MESVVCDRLQTYNYMKNYKGIVGIALCCLILFICTVYIEKIQTKDRYTNHIEPDMEIIKDSLEEKQDEKDKDNILTINGVSIEVLSCEMIEDYEIDKQKKYQAKYFATGSLPDANYEEEYIDYDAIKEVCPELRDLWDNNHYSTDEAKKIYNDNLEIIKQYTVTRHPKTRYIFANYRITNVSGKVNDACLDMDIFIKSDKSEFLEIQMGSCYFDKAVNLTGEDREKRFFWYLFDKDEVMECVIGYEIKQVWDENEEYYVGVQSPGIDYFNLENTRTVPLQYK